MDFTKFVSLLEKGALFFARADKLGDPFEGALSKVNFAAHPMLYGDNAPQLTEQFLRFLKESRRFTLINCWHENQHESASMWKLYSEGGGTIAVKTDQEALTKSLIDDDVVCVGRVIYVDYENYFIPENNAFAPYLHKRLSFEHEKEVRAVIQTIPIAEGGLNLSRELYDVGKYHQVNVPSLVTQVVIYPYAQEWFTELVTSVVNRYALSIPVVKSNLSERPRWA